MAVFALNEHMVFPSPEQADENGLLAVGGDLSVQRLLLGYSCGIFPWNHPEDPLLWWSPDPRCVLRPDELHISRSMSKRMRQGNYCITFNKAFEQCIHSCASADDRQEGTWISPDIIRAYITLHHLGYAHSVECWMDGTLAGGLYGVALGRCFCGESMFHHSKDASKLAFIALAQHLQQLGYQLIDCQIPTDHLHSLGAYDITRKEFLERLGHCQLVEKGRLQPGRFDLEEEKIEEELVAAEGLPLP
jgi:leucyl/phenylalanyl-tRNA--protein transferase